MKNPCRFTKAWCNFNPDTSVDFLRLRSSLLNSAFVVVLSCCPEFIELLYHKDVVDSANSQFTPLWTIGPLDRWTFGPLDRWTFGRLDLWTCYQQMYQKIYQQIYQQIYW